MSNGDGRALLHCHAGCTPEAVCEALGLELRDLFDDPAPTPGAGVIRLRSRRAEQQRAPRAWDIPDEDVAAVHAYTDDVEVVRFTAAARERGRPKCLPRHRANGQWFVGLGPHRAADLPLYAQEDALVAVIEGAPLYIVEGESDADAVSAAGAAATTNYGGAGKFQPCHAARVARAASGQAGGPADGLVLVVEDGDEPGAQHAADVVGKLTAAGLDRSRIRRVRAAQGHDARDHLAAGLGLDALVEIEPEPVDIWDRRLDLAAVRARPQQPSPLPGLLPPEPGLGVVHARTKVGKTRLALWIAQAAAAGVAPWEGAPPLTLGPVAYIDAEDNARATARVLDDMAALADPSRDGWEDAFGLFALDPLLDAEAEGVLRLTAEGLELVRQLARRCGLIVIDSLSRAKPSEADENSNDDMSALLDALQRIAVQEGCYVLLVHHRGWGEREGPEASRGASAITTVPRVLWALTRDDANPRRRRLEVAGNAVPAGSFTFEVVSEAVAAPGLIQTWRWIDENAQSQASPGIESALPEIGAECSTSGLARALFSLSPRQRPTGDQSRRAREVRDRWERAGLVEVIPRGRTQTLRRLR